MPFMRDQGRTRLENVYMPGKKSKAISAGPGGNFVFYTDGATVPEVVRRSLETCGALAGVPCMVVAIDDLFVVPVPTIMKPTGMFRAGESPSIASDARDDVARQLTEASTGWNAVAVGSSGRPGMAVKAASEQDAINGALANCAKRDGNCHIIAIGPYTVSSISR
jgi:adenylate cyclase